MLPSSFDPWLLLALVVAIGIGWLLGRFQQPLMPDNKPAAENARLSREYFVGLDHLLNHKTDEAIESFIRALEVNTDTIPAHLALAKLFRRKGDVQRAIQIHQTLLARPDLAHADSLRIQMALAIDYDAIGLLDRAENLLQDIIRQSPPADIRRKALTLLVKLFEKEGEWQQALDTAMKLSPEQRQQLCVELAHYSCELAERAIAKGAYKQAETYLQQALCYDPRCVRVSILTAQVAQQEGRWKVAVKALRQVELQDKIFVSETLPSLKRCYEALGQKQEYEQYLRHCLQNVPSASVIIALADVITADRGHYAAGAFITDELKHRPSVKGFNRLIDLHLEHGGDRAKDSLKVLRSLTGALELNKPTYCCQQCGFSARTLSWQCPSCKQWGTTRPIQGLEGE